MRAETENAVAAIEKSLDLLAQRLDWDSAQHRLEEFNAMAEDPNLWDDPERAQKLMYFMGFTAVPPIRIS